MKKTLILMVAGSLLVACGPQSSDPVVVTAEPPMDSAEEFVARVNDELIDLNREGGAASWIRATYITEDTAIISSLADEKYAEWHSRTVKQAAMYDGQELAPATRRALDQLKLGTSLPAPDDADKRKELARLATDLRGMYGAGQYCRSDNDCMSLQDIENTLADSRDFEQLKEAWDGWRTISPPMRDKFQRYVELANEGASELGYSDLGDKWRSGYDMSSTEFEQETSRLWEQVKPLYDELHCHVRAKLAEQYGEEKLYAFVADHANLNTDEFANELIETISGWSGGKEKIDDDMAIIVIDVE